jgi:phenylacetate-coenzyme A ligase PaaK-like adenylate-forming protein
VAEYRVEIRSGQALTELTVLIEPSLQCRDEALLASAVEKSFRDAFSLRVPVTVTGPGALPRFEMKAQRWVRFETR